MYHFEKKSVDKRQGKKLSVSSNHFFFLETDLETGINKLQFLGGKKIKRTQSYDR